MLLCILVGSSTEPIQVKHILIAIAGYLDWAYILAIKRRNKTEIKWAIQTLI